VCVRGIGGTSSKRAPTAVKGEACGTQLLLVHLLILCGWESLGETLLGGKGGRGGVGVGGREGKSREGLRTQLDEGVLLF